MDKIIDYAYTKGYFVIRIFNFSFSIKHTEWTELSGQELMKRNTFAIKNIRFSWCYNFTSSEMEDLKETLKLPKYTFIKDETTGRHVKIVTQKKGWYEEPCVTTKFVQSDLQ